MQSRRYILTSTILAATASRISSVVAQQSGDINRGMPGMPGMGSGGMTVQECIESCFRCHRICLETGWYCSEKGGLHAAATHLALMLDCAEMCQTAGNSLARRSPRHGVLCIACADLCDACAVDCEAFGNDEQMRLCASTCRQCAAHCREMSKRQI